MSKIRVEIEINPSNLNEVQAFSALMLAMGGNDTATIQVPTNLGKAGGFKAPTIETAKAVVEAPAPTDKVEEAKSEVEIKTYSEDELKSMDNDDLKELATGLGIDWATEQGKNTNAKLIRLILENYKGGEAPAPAEKVEEAEASAPAATTEKSAETESDVSLDDLKIELGVKVDTNRDAIVAKLKEFGATKLSNLPEENYSEMLTFLKALK